MTARSLRDRGPQLNQLTQMDGLLHVARCFENPHVPHPAGSVDPGRDIAAMDAELLLNDLIAVERKLERLGDERRKGGGREKNIIEREIALFERLHQALSDEKPLRDVEIDPEEEKVLSGFGLLTRKPVLLVLNLGEGQAAPNLVYSHHHSAIIGLQGQLEMEIAQLPQDEAQVFLEEYDIQEPSLNRVIRQSHDLLGLLSFFTVGEDEVRAWTVRRGANAHEAAGVTRNDTTKMGPSGGPITKDNTNRVEYYGTIFALAESPAEPGDLLWADSDDGLIHLTRDGGRTWDNVTPRGMPA